MTKLAPAVLNEHIDCIIAESEASLIALRRHFHANPEISRREFKTTKELQARLLGLGGLEITVREEKVGLVADLSPPWFDPTQHPTVAIRSDIDALAILEETELTFASNNKGVMHACGHDMHMACVTGAAIALTEFKEQLPGRIRFIYQHAEETAPGGALDMVREGFMEGVDRIIGLHVDPKLPVGQVGVRIGAFTAATDSFNLTLHGKGGHSARPHEGTDIVFVLTQILNAYYQATSRLFDARFPIAFAVGAINGGAAFNVIPDNINARGTIRSVKPEQRERLLSLFEAIVKSNCALYGATFELEIINGSPAVINEAYTTNIITEVATKILGGQAIIPISHASMGAEDFSEFLQVVPGAMFRLGVLGDRPGHFLHSPRFDPDEDAIAIGSRILARSALRLLSELSEP